MVSCSKLKLVSLLSLLFLLSACETGGDAPGSVVISPPGDPFDGYTCNTTVTTDLTKVEFEALLQAGASASAPYRICLADGVEINAAESDLYLMVNNVEIRGANTRTAILHNVSASITGSSNLIRIINVNIKGDNTGALSIDGTGSYEIMDSSITASGGMMQSVLYIYNGPTVLIRNCQITSTSFGSNEAIGVEVQNVPTTVTIENSVITFAGGSGLYFHHQGSSATGNLKGNTFKATNTSNIMIGPYGISVLSQGGSGTLNDTSGSTKNFFCEIPGISDDMDGIFDHTNQGGSFGGTFSTNNTQNGNNTNIGNCP